MALTCPLCTDSEEGMASFLVYCRHTRDGRDPWLKAALGHIPLVFKDHLHNWSAQELAHLVLDPSHPAMEEKLPLHRNTIHLIAKGDETSNLCSPQTQGNSWDSGRDDSVSSPSVATASGHHLYKHT